MNHINSKITHEEKNDFFLESGKKRRELEKEIKKLEDMEYTMLCVTLFQWCENNYENKMIDISSVIDNRHHFLSINVENVEEDFYCEQLFEGMFSRDIYDKLGDKIEYRGVQFMNNPEGRVTMLEKTMGKKEAYQWIKMDNSINFKTHLEENLEKKSSVKIKNKI